MKINVGDYVRTSTYGILKAEKFVGYTDDVYEMPFYSVDMGGYIPENEIIKSSPNIIDLIEVGDYVNGKKVTKTNLDKTMNGETTILCGDSNYDCLDVIYKNRDIKSIVTKEQFSQMEYRINE